MKKFFDALKTVYGPQSSGTTTLLSADGTSLLTDKEAILKRWAEHFDGVLNRPSSIIDEAIMANFGCPAKFIAMVRQFHDDMLARDQNDGEFSDPFPVTNGVNQGCVLASTLFSMTFSAMLTDAFQDGDTGIPIRYRFDGKLFNLGRLQAKSKVQTEVLDEFLFADDMAKGAPTEEKMKKGVDKVSDSCDSYDLTISIKQTEVAPGKPYKEPTITVKGQRLQVVDTFTYLGSTLSRVVHIDDEVNARIAKATAAFGRLRGSIWD